MDAKTVEAPTVGEGCEWHVGPDKQEEGTWTQRG